MSDFHIVVFFNDYYTLIVAFFDETDTEQIQIQTSSRLSNILALNSANSVKTFREYSNVSFSSIFAGDRAPVWC